MPEGLFQKTKQQLRQTSFNKPHFLEQLQMTMTDDIMQSTDNFR